MNKAHVVAILNPTSIGVRRLYSLVFFANLVRYTERPDARELLKK